MADVAPRPHGFRARFGFASQKSASSRKLSKKSAPPHDVHTAKSPSNPYPLKSPDSFIDGATSSSASSFSIALTNTVSKNSPYAYARPQPPRKLSKQPRQSHQHALIDKDTGERKDLTDMMHAFTYNEATDSSSDSPPPASAEFDYSRPDGAPILGSAIPEIWALIADLLSPLDIANLAMSCRTMYSRLGKRAYDVLRDPANRVFRLTFLLEMDSKLPNHLFCFPCAQWHLRTHPGLEKLKPPTVLNPLFRCPNVANNLLPPPRLRLSEGRTLPFAFVQLAKRAWARGPAYGIPHQNLARRWKDPYSDWVHETLYHIHSNGHVLVRIKSQVFVHGGMTPAAKRLLLFNRADYTPYFSVCAHWRKGVLTSIPKCALDHIPVPKVNAITHLLTQKAAGPVALCGHCRPMRRCPECPTEYLFELKLIEDKNVKTAGPERFKQALLVTRWSDLGPAYSPDDEEWSSIVGARQDYNSVIEIGRRAISGIFESAFTDTIPGQRILSMNPDGVLADEESGDWY